MKTLNEYNEERLKEHKRLTTFPRKNGIACPKCNGEMSDINNVILGSYPSKKQVYCESCSYNDYAYC